MEEIPAEMKRNNREPDQDFFADEYLYRRVPDILWDDDEINIGAIELPDISVNRQKYGPAWWVRYIETGDSTPGARSFTLTEMGVIGFMSKDIPPRQAFQGVFLYRFQVVHAPEKYNYPHSEIRAFESKLGDPEGRETHVDGKGMIKRIDPIWHLQWRERLARKCRVVLRPREPAK
jgi:hypothetical protein